ncbi:cupin domain-containing protein [Gimesia maris]|jgi:quercetin dioxygenase-like cupin family protein|uniref:Cupin n=1 Tax=Gimesia maris TaxID=122 RepID=A0A3D3R3J2_9PLAN|nr:cupin [Gimesia maris]|tara:strand:+ start:275 stop:607 length:333 start_codon:yes stop_codon:yes gene_type:complete
MAIPHSQPGELVDVQPLGDALANQKTYTISKTEDLELIRLILPAGKIIPTHRTPGQITVQCIEGEVHFSAMGQEQKLEAGQLLFLLPGVPHSVRAVKDSSLLLTLVLQHK